MGVIDVRTLLSIRDAALLMSNYVRQLFLIVLCCGSWVSNILATSFHLGTV